MPDTTPILSSYEQDDLGLFAKNTNIFLLKTTLFCLAVQLITLTISFIDRLEKWPAAKQIAEIETTDFLQAAFNEPTNKLRLQETINEIKALKANDFQTDAPSPQPSPYPS